MKCRTTVSVTLLLLAVWALPTLAYPVTPVYYSVTAGQFFPAGDDAEPGHVLGCSRKIML